MNRRRFLTTVAAGTGLLCAPLRGIAQPMHGERALSLYNLHTQESINLVYWADGVYVAAQLDQINHILRDYRTGDLFPIDIRVLDYLHAVATQLQLRDAFQIVSGFRSQRTNAMLHDKNADGVAKNSLHTRGMAVDVKLERIPLETLERAARSVVRGGVGYYPGQFVHLDAGPVRQWSKKKTKGA